MSFKLKYAAINDQEFFNAFAILLEVGVDTKTAFNRMNLGGELAKASEEIDTKKGEILAKYTILKTNGTIKVSKEGTPLSKSGGEDAATAALITLLNSDVEFKSDKLSVDAMAKLNGLTNDQLMATTICAQLFS